MNPEDIVSSDSSDDSEDEAVRNQFTNVEAPKVTEETHYKVGDINIGNTEDAGFSFMSMFNRELDDEKVEKESEKSAEPAKPASLNVIRTIADDGEQEWENFPIEFIGPTVNRP